MVAVVWPNGLTVEPRRSDPYGPRKPITTDAGTTRPFHVGGDWLLGGGKSHAVLAGTVVDAGPMGALGQQVLVYVGVINGSHHWVRYCHLKDGSIRVGVGSKVSAGTVLGIEGKTGVSVGVHSHIEAYRDGLDRGSGMDPGDTIDPRAFIRSMFNQAAGGGETPFPEGDDMPFTPEEIKSLAREGAKAAIYEAGVEYGGNPSGYDHWPMFLNAVWNAPLQAQDAGGKGLVDAQGKPVRFTAAGFLASVTAQVAALREVVQTLAVGQGLDPDAIADAAEKGAAKALDNLSFTVVGEMGKPS